MYKKGNFWLHSSGLQQPFWGGSQHNLYLHRCCEADAMVKENIAVHTYCNKILIQTKHGKETCTENTAEHDTSTHETQQHNNNIHGTQRQITCISWWHDWYCPVWRPRLWCYYNTVPKKWFMAISAALMQFQKGWAQTYRRHNIQLFQQQNLS